MGRADVLVIGAGVSGLTCAYQLLQDHHRVRIWAAKRPADTTSAVAAATWLPYAVDQSDERTIGWALETLAVFKELAASADATTTGIRMTDDILVLKRRGRPPAWAERVPGLRSAVDVGLLPKDKEYAGGAGFVFPGPVIDMSVYLAYLETQIVELQRRQGMDPAESGIHICQPLTSWDEVFANWAPAVDATTGTPLPRVIVNCIGLGARDSALVEDDKVADDKTDDPVGVTPARGQIVRVARQDVAFNRVVVDETEGEQPTYMVTRLNDIVLGGTFEPGEDDLSATQETQKTRMDILNRCVKLSLAIGERAFAASLAKLGGGWVEEAFEPHAPSDYAAIPAAQDADAARPDICGLRPVRGSVRLERDPQGRPIIHNYGHGGSGVTLSWGCARSVAQTVAEFLN